MWLIGKSIIALVQVHVRNTFPYILTLCWFRRSLTTFSMKRKIEEAVFIKVGKINASVTFHIYTIITNVGPVKSTGFFIIVEKEICEYTGAVIKELCIIPVGSYKNIL